MLNKAVPRILERLYMAIYLPIALGCLAYAQLWPIIIGVKGRI